VGAVGEEGNEEGEEEAVEKLHWIYDFRLRCKFIPSILSVPIP
jgi:hypothetical protein